MSRQFVRAESELPGDQLFVPGIQGPLLPHWGVSRCEWKRSRAPASLLGATVASFERRLPTVIIRLVEEQ
jgi:hypothetical protein